MPDLKMADAASTRPAPVTSVLAVQDLQAWYGESHILHGINFNVNAGEVVTLLGRNGAGKTTTLKSVMGIIGKRTGSVRFNDRDIIRSSSDKIARMGVAFCPEERGIFASLDVRENLLLPPIVRSGGLSLDQIFELFPNLKERADTSAGVLSGGEKQMLTICRTLMGDPELIMIDEPTEGLAPLIVQQVGDLIAEIARRGVAILLVEQKLSIAMRISHRVYVMGHGRIVFEGTPAELKANEAVRKEWLEV